MRSDQPIVVGVGELLWDCFPDARRPGGAPANVAFHARQLGLNGVIFSRVGRDQLGDELIQFVADHGLSTGYVQRDDRHETSRVTVDLTRPEHPAFIIHEHAAWDYLALDPDTTKVMGNAAAICFGTLAQRSQTSRDTIHGCISVASSTCSIVYDVNLRAPWYDRDWIERSLHAAQIVKLNAEELHTLASLLELGTDRPQSVAQQLLGLFNVELVCVTRGTQGCLLVDGTRIADAPGIEVDVSDPVGSGDAFTAALIFATLRGWRLEATAGFANQVAALVASQPGAMPELSQPFAEIVSRFEGNSRQQ